MREEKVGERRERERERERETKMVIGVPIGKGTYPQRVEWLVTGEARRAVELAQVGDQGGRERECHGESREEYSE